MPHLVAITISSRRSAERAADEVFALAVGAVDVGRVEMIDADVEALLDRGDAVGLVGVERRHAGDRPAAERDGRNFKSRIAQRTALHFVCSFFNHEGTTNTMLLALDLVFVVPSWFIL